MYTYHGDRHTDPKYRKATCEAVRATSGKCIRGKNGNMLVMFTDGATCVVVARLLRKVKASIILATPDTELSQQIGHQVTIFEKGNL